MNIFDMIKGLIHPEKPKSARKGKACKATSSKEAADEALRVFFSKRK